MSITTALLIAILIVFSLILLFMIFLMSPIMKEIHLTMREFRLSTTIVRKRVEQVDGMIHKLMGVFTTVNAMGRWLNWFNRKKEKDKEDEKTVRR